MPLASGVILFWSGSVNSIPAGFVICDGTNSTPDLRDRFIVGAGSTYAVDDTGGGLTHNHTFTTDGHLHSISAGFGIASGNNFDPNTNDANDTGTTDNTSSLPPFYALAYIMKT